MPQAGRIAFGAMEAVTFGRPAGMHPALPGVFNGAHAIQRAWEAFKDGKITKTGVMIHYVIEEVDEGEPILVREITMEHGESLEDLETRIHKIEHEAIVEGTIIALETLKKDRGDSCT